MRIALYDIRIFAYHGVMPQEHVVGDWYTVNLQLTVSDETSTQSDLIADTVDYSKVFEVVKREMLIPSKLMEHVCGRITRAILEQFSLVNAVRVTVIKQNPPIGAECGGCGVELTQERQQ
ncbi:MAG: dihydroneopterin aldolase [Bacteroidaceae bacterium]|nr:dihydroneopterin aldolase [Bacteroidaceae bacterium]